MLAARVSRRRSRRRARTGSSRCCARRAATPSPTTRAASGSTRSSGGGSDRRHARPLRRSGERLAGALRTLGVDSRVGRVPDEFCPGDFTVNARGAVKLVGTAQRVVRHASLLAASVVVRDADSIRAVLRDVYRGARALLGPADRRRRGDEVPGDRRRRRARGARRLRPGGRARRARRGDARARAGARAASRGSRRVTVVDDQRVAVRVAEVRLVADARVDDVALRTRRRGTRAGARAAGTSSTRSAIGCPLA